MPLFSCTKRPITGCLRGFVKIELLRMHYERAHTKVFSTFVWTERLTQAFGPCLGNWAVRSSCFHSWRFSVRSSGVFSYTDSSQSGCTPQDGRCWLILWRGWGFAVFFFPPRDGFWEKKGGG